MTDRRVHALADFFRVLADPHRLRILQVLAEYGERTVTALGDDLGQSQPAVSHHLLQLKSVGLIAFRRNGKFNHYRLDEVGIAKIVREWGNGDPAVRVAAAGVELSVRAKPA